MSLALTIAALVAVLVAALSTGSLSAQVGQQPGVSGPPAATFTGGTVTGQILGPSGACITTAFAFSASPGSGIGYNAPLTETLICNGGGPAISTGSNVGDPIRAYSYGWLSLLAGAPEVSYEFAGTSSGDSELAFRTAGSVAAKEYGSFKVLTESSATDFLQYTIGGGASGGSLEYVISAFDVGSEQQSLVGTLRWAAVSKLGAVTCSVSETGTPLLAASTGTLTATFTCATGASLMTLRSNSVSSLTQLGIVLRWYNTAVGTNAYDPVTP